MPAACSSSEFEQWVVPNRELQRIGEKQVSDRAGLSKPRREWKVIPGAVLADNPGVKAVQDRTGPVHRGEQGGHDGEANPQAAARKGSRWNAVQRRPSPKAEAGGGAGGGDDECRFVQQADKAEHLACNYRHGKPKNDRSPKPRGASPGGSKY